LLAGITAADESGSRGGQSIVEVVAIHVVEISDISEFSDISGSIAIRIWFVGMAQAHTVETIMSAAKSLFLALGTLPGTFHMNNAPAMILPRHATPRSLRSAVAGKVGIDVPCSVISVSPRRMR
jgi:hypothetical protein